jgi:hypothetical protein
VDPYDIDKHKKDKYGYGRSGRTKITYKFERGQIFSASPKNKD